MTTPLLNISESLRRRRERPWPRSRTPSSRRYGWWWTTGGSCWACWQETFSRGRWSLSLQPPPLQLQVARVARAIVSGHPRVLDRVGPNPWRAAVSESHRVETAATRESPPSGHGPLSPLGCDSDATGGRAGSKFAVRRASRVRARNSESSKPAFHSSLYSRLL